MRNRTRARSRSSLLLAYALSGAVLPIPQPANAAPDWSWSIEEEIGEDGGGSASFDPVDGVLLVNAFEKNPDLATRVVGEGRESRTRVRVAFDVTNGVEPGQGYRIVVGINEQSAQTNVDRVNLNWPDVHWVINQNVPYASGHGAAGLVVRSHYIETINCFADRCEARDDGPSYVRYLACSDPEEYPPDWCTPRGPTRLDAGSYIYETSPDATRSYFRVNIVLEALAAIGDWRGEEAISTAQMAITDFFATRV